MISTHSVFLALFHAIHSCIHPLCTHLLSSSVYQDMYYLQYSANTLHLSVSNPLLISFPLPGMYVPLLRYQNPAHL